MEKIDRYMPQSMASSSVESTSVRPLSPTISPSNENSESAIRRAKILLGCYRKGDAEDPETYVAAVSAVLAKYPPYVAGRVTDPRSGLPGRSKFLPTVSEVAEACEREMAPVWADEARRNRQELAEMVIGSPSPRSQGVSQGLGRLREALTPIERKAEPTEADLEALKEKYASEPIQITTPAMLAYLERMKADQSDEGESP